jgi:diguanylate cyclase (GGDEF)-like protein/PAS domain S-box-containing protein
MNRIFSCLGGEHDLRLVVLAGVVCFLASFAAVSLLQRARATRGRVRLTWVLTAGAATGYGIWATHFIAMLAYEPGVPVAYDIDLTILSLVAAVALTTGGIYFAVAGSSSRSAVVAGGIVGAGVACMHYTGMSALELPGRITWSFDLVLLSIVTGMLFGMAAMAIAVRREEWRGTSAAAFLLALAILSHHFTAMGAVDIVPDPTRIIQPFSLSPDHLALMLAAGAISVLGMCIVAAFVHRRGEGKLRTQNMRLDMAVNNMVQGLCMFGPDERLVLCNRRYLDMYGLSPALVKPGCTFEELLAHRAECGNFPGDRQQYMTEARAALAASIATKQIVELADGRTMSVVSQPTPGGGWVATHEDISERRNAEKELDRTRIFLNTVIENVPATLVVKDARECRYVLVNRAGEEFFGMSRDEMIGKKASDIFPAAEAEAIVARDNEVLRSGEPLFIEEHPVETPRKGMRLVTSKRLALPGDDGKPQYVLGFLEDVTERKQAQDRIKHMAHHDALTDLPNRAAFNEALALALEQRAASGQSFAVMCTDLDHFKEVNDVCGHSVGDAVLCELARRMRAAAAGAFVARLGGDEFTMISSIGEQPATAAALADCVLAAVAEDLEINGRHLLTGISIGIAVYPTDGTDATTLLANADAALYRAKAEGRGSIRFFEPDMDRRLRERRALQHDLQTAVSRGELTLHYQPQALMQGDVVGFEALVRWRHPTRGMISPATFIPIAEESGLIVPIGEWILREACREAASWARPLQISVNLSPVQFRRGDLAGLVHAVLLETGLAPRRLELEITESVLVSDFSRAVSVLRRIKALGARIAMDDFGTGYSSLSYLQSFPFDKIKIDKAFIANVARNAQSATIVRAIIGLARGLGLPVIAEGVETREQLDFLAQANCDQVQGYLLGRPEPIAHYAATIAAVGDPPRKLALAVA